MKIRNGFVSNSSSSSFILKFDEKPTSVEHLKQILFGNNIPEYLSSYNLSIETDLVIDKLYGDILSYETNINIFSNCNIDDYKDILFNINNNDSLNVLINDIIKLDNQINIKFGELNINEDKDEIKKEINRLLLKINDLKVQINNNLLIYFKEKYGNNTFFVNLEFSDYNLIDRILEKGDIFKKLAIIKINNH
jgi:hypothetical protein